MSSSVKFETDGLYIVLSDLGGNNRFHWGLYLETSPKHGDIFHLTEPDNSKGWVYETRSTGNMSDSARLLVAVKVAVVDSDLRDALSNRLAIVPIEYSARFREDITCRVWLKEALFALDNEGYIKLTQSVNEIENEAKIAAMTNKYRNDKSVIKSKGSVC